MEPKKSWWKKFLQIFKKADTALDVFVDSGLVNLLPPKIGTIVVITDKVIDTIPAKEKKTP